MMIHKLCFSVAFCSAICLGFATTQAQETTEKSPAAGSWKFERESLSGNVKCQIRLTEKDGKFKGTYSDAEDVKARVGNVTIEGDEITIKLVFDDDGASEVTLTGKIDDDTIVGKMVDGDDKQDWKAKRFVSLEDAVGKWRMSFTTPDGMERNPEFELKLKDGKPVLDFEVGEDVDEAAQAKVSNIKFKEGLLVFDIALDFQGQELKLEYELEFDSPDTLEGSMYFEFAGNDQSGDVDLDGERIK